MKTTKYLLGMMFLLPATMLYSQKFEVNTQASSIEWVGKKVASQHNGHIQLKSGSFELKDDRLVAGEFVVDMTTITNEDLDNENRNQRLVGHLKSDDFFGVEEYPTARFAVTQSSKFSDEKATLSGNITIKGKTEPITFEVTRTGMEYSARMEIDRSKFDVRFGSDSFFDNLGDNAINDIFVLEIKLVVL